MPPTDDEGGVGVGLGVGLSVGVGGGVSGTRALVMVQLPALRAALHTGRFPRGLLPAAAVQYIRAHALYKEA